MLVEGWTVEGCVRSEFMLLLKVETIVETIVETTDSRTEIGVTIAEAEVVMTTETDDPPTEVSIDVTTEEDMVDDRGRRDVIFREIEEAHHDVTEDESNEQNLV